MKVAFFSSLPSEMQLWVTDDARLASKSLPAHWVAFSAERMPRDVCRLKTGKEGLLYYNFDRREFSAERPRERPGDEWQAVAPRKSKPAPSRTELAADEVQCVQIRMPKGARPYQVFEFKYMDQRCTFKVPKGYKGEEILRLVPPQGESRNSSRWHVD